MGSEYDGRLDNKLLNNTQHIASLHGWQDHLTPVNTLSLPCADRTCWGYKITTSVEWPVGNNIIGIHITLKSHREWQSKDICNIHSHFSWPFEGTVWEDVFSSAWLERSKYRSTTHFFIGDKKSITPKSASQIFTPIPHTQNHFGIAVTRFNLSLRKIFIIAFY